MNNRHYRPARVAKFLRLLFQLLKSEDPQVIAWTDDGNAFEIYDAKRLEQEILPKYFKHNKITSLQRQLNYFGFRKWTKSRSHVSTFSHPYFTKNDPDLLVVINRKPNKKKLAMATKKTVQPIVELLEDDLSDLQMEFLPEDPWDIIFRKYEQDPLC